MTTLLKTSPALNCKFSVSDDLGQIEGLASPFNAEPDSYGDIIANGAFTTSLASNSPVVMLWAHDQARPVGRWIELKETEKGLWVRGKLNLRTDAGLEAYEHVKSGDLTGLSIGYEINEGGWKRHKGGRILTDLRLHEISLVTVPAAAEARISGVKSINSASDLKSALREIGLARAAAEKITRGGWPALSGKPNENQTLIEQIRDLREAAAQINGRADT